VVPGAATLFFVNDDGWAVTCKHVADLIINADHIVEQYHQFQQERGLLPVNKNRKAALKRLEQKYNYHSGVTVQIKNNFLDCVTPINEIDFIMHGNCDLAILHFNGYTERHYQGHAIFAKSDNIARPGDFLCRLGYPFPEYSDFSYDATSDEINWVEGGQANSPRFPMEGMFTRHLQGINGEIMGIELSTPGLRGQSGGPLFNSDGIVLGMQSATNHLHLGFDMINANIPISGKMETVNNQPFLHVGQCIHASIIKRFLDDNHVKYYVGDSIDSEEVVNG
jgi:hypothetical protein